MNNNPEALGDPIRAERKVQQIMRLSDLFKAFS
jgi:hypothetical protein